MSTKCVLDASLGISGVRALRALEPTRLQCALEFLSVIAIEFSGKSGHVRGRVEALAEPDPVDNGQLRPAEQRPALAQVGRVGLDPQGLHGTLARFGAKTPAPARAANRRAGGARALG